MRCNRTRLSDQIPKDLKGNLRWRRKVYQRISEDPGFAETIKEACARDSIFFVNGFCWTYDPRCEPFSRIPMILYDFQEEALLEIIRAIGSRDLLIEKSRDMGASWICMLAFFWCWLYKSRQSFLMGSRVEAYVDDSANPKSLFWKIDFILDNLPPWLRPKGYKTSLHRRKLHIGNPENGSVIDGESTNPNFAKGDRRTAILLDEFAAVECGPQVCRASRDATNCRIFNSTPMGTGNSFYDQRQNPDCRRLRLHWSSHPLKMVGLYMSTSNGELQVLDKKGYPDGYKPILDGKMRSVWYDIQCSRADNAREIAQEIDIDYLGSGHQFFDAQKVQVAIRDFAHAPLEIGDLDFDTKTAEPTTFRENPEGNLKLWFFLGRKKTPQIEHRCVIGVDVSAGTGSSNSALCVWDAVTNEKLAEWASPYVRPEALAKQAVAIAKWFGNAMLIWESNGPGRQFGSRVMELGYTRIYLRVREEKLSRKVSDIPGWAPTREGKLVLLGAYREALEKGHCVNRSKIALEETLEYVYAANGGVEHSRAKNKSDPSGAGASHGDRVIGDALAWKGVTQRKLLRIKEKPEVPVGSLAWRNAMRDQDKQTDYKELPEGWN